MCGNSNLVPSGGVKLLGEEEATEGVVVVVASEILASATKPPHLETAFCVTLPLRQH